MHVHSSYFGKLVFCFFVGICSHVFMNLYFNKGWLAIAKLKPLSLFISLLSMLKKAFYNVEIEK